MHQPHDKLFKAGFSDPETAGGFLRDQLDPGLAALIDWPSLELTPGSFIDSQFRQSESDLLFYARAGEQSVAFYLLFEHQTTEDPDLALRLLRYMVRIWESHRKKSPGTPLPVILPVILAQNDRVWKLRPDFASLLDLPAALEDPLRASIPDFTFRLVQLAELPFEAIAGTPAGVMVLRTMKAERAGQLTADPVWDEALLSRLPRELFELLLRYMFSADIDPAAFKDRLKAISEPELQSTAMTLAQSFHQEGRQEGRQEGMQQGRQEAMQEAVLDNLEIRFGPVPAVVAKAVRTVTDTTRLKDLQRASLTCDTLESFSSAR